MRHEEVADPRQHTRDHRDEDTQRDIAVNRATTGAHHDHLLPEGRGEFHRRGLHQDPLQVEGRLIVTRLLTIESLFLKTIRTTV